MDIFHHLDLLLEVQPRKVNDHIPVADMENVRNFTQAGLFVPKSALGKAYWIIFLPFVTKDGYVHTKNLPEPKKKYPSSARLARYIFHV